MKAGGERVVAVILLIGDLYGKKWGNGDAEDLHKAVRDQNLFLSNISIQGLQEESGTLGLGQR